MLFILHTPFWVCLHAFLLQRQHLNVLVSSFCENILDPSIRVTFFSMRTLNVLCVIFKELISAANTFVERRSSIVIIFHLGDFRFYRECKTYYSTFNICLLLDVRAKVEKFKFYSYIAASKELLSAILFSSFGCGLKTIFIRKNIRYFVSRNAKASNRG